MKYLRLVLRDLWELLEQFGAGIVIMAAIGWFFSACGVIPIIFAIVGTDPDGEPLHIIQRIFLGSFGVAGWIIVVTWYIQDLKRRGNRE